MRTLSKNEAMRFYDKFGKKQDGQAFYEDTALELLISHSDFRNARNVIEFGCGTGRMALQLLEHELSREAHYLGVDISSTMVNLARARLGKYRERAQVKQMQSKTIQGIPYNQADRYLSTYVFDLLSEKEIREKLSEAYKLLKPSGLICLAGITLGSRLLSRFVMEVWDIMFTIHPQMTGGCRPIVLEKYFDRRLWETRFNETVTAFGVASEVLVAKKISA